MKGKLKIILYCVNYIKNYLELKVKEQCLQQLYYFILHFSIRSLA
jgi:hypothetical protein